MTDGTGQGPRPVEAATLARTAAVVIDPRLADLWQMIWRSASLGDEHEDFAMETVAALLRLAYAQGYADAHSEPLRGSLFSELGLRPPRTRRPSGSRSRPGKARPGSSDK